MADAVTVVARRDIRAGEEVTVDYALQTAQPVPLVEMPCACGAANCRDWRLPSVQARYAGRFAPYINRRIEALV